MGSKPKVCLNMIVKNESHIIQETLSSMLKYIDGWVITDTGSTDNTIELIQNFFSSHNIPGKIYHDEWVDFGTNRTRSLNNTYDYFVSKENTINFDYIWIMDADDIVVGDINLYLDDDLDGFYLKYGKDFVYDRAQIIKTNLKWRYRGVLHEFIQCIDKPNTKIIRLQGNYYIDSRRLGARSQNPNKYLADAEVLVKAIDQIEKTGIDQDLKSRYAYYAAQSYFDHRDWEKAAYWARKRIEFGGWNEETYCSGLKLCWSLERLGKDIKEISIEYLKCDKIISDRFEALFYLGIYFKKLAMSNNERSKEYLTKAEFFLNKNSLKKNNPNYKLFIYSHIHQWENKYELAHVSYLLGKYDIANNYCDELLINQHVRSDLHKIKKIWELKNLCTKYDSNQLTIYPEKKINDILKKVNNNVEYVEGEKKYLSNNITLTITTCKRYDLFEKTINSFLNCCKDFDLIDRWICVDDNSSKEDRDNMQFKYPFFEYVFKSADQKGHSVSMNTIKDLVTSPYVLHLEDDWLFVENTYYIKPALSILESKSFTVLDSNSSSSNQDLDFDKKEIAQVLFNINYSEDVDMVVNGGLLIENNNLPKIKFILHEYLPNKPHRLEYNLNCAYWPHYSFRPSLFKSKIFRELGDFESIGFFEISYAKRYYSKNYISCFFNKITTIHIGKKTTEKVGLNAYNLNGVNQFKIENNNKLNQINETLRNKFIYVDSYDSYGNDILYYNVKDINELVTIGDSIDNCVCFNTYGYFKNILNKELFNLKITHGPNVDHGLFINRIVLNGTINYIVESGLVNTFESIDLTVLDNLCKDFDNKYREYQIVLTDKFVDKLSNKYPNKFVNNNVDQQQKEIKNIIYQLQMNLLNDEYKNFDLIFINLDSNGNTKSFDNFVISNKFYKYLKNIKEKENIVKLDNDFIIKYEPNIFFITINMLD